MSNIVNKIKDFFSLVFSNKKQVITVLVIGIIALSIPVALQLSQKQQILKSRASGEDGKYIIHSLDGNIYRTVSQMKTELQNAGWAGKDLDRPPKELFYIFERNEVVGPGNRSMNCTVNKGDLANMPTEIQAINAGDRVAVTIVQKWEDEPTHLARDAQNREYTEHNQWSCNEWYPNVKFTNKTTGKVYDHLCTNANYENHFNQSRPDEQNPGLYDTFSPLEQVKSCTVTIPEAGKYDVEIAYTDRNDPKAKDGSPNGCVTNGWVMSHCGFQTGVGSNSGVTGGSGSGNYTVAGKVRDSSGNAVSGATITLHNAKDGATQTLTTGSDGSYSGKLNSGDTYSVRTTDTKYHAVGGDHTFMFCGINKDVSPNQPSPGYPNYECQTAGSNDCAGGGRCDFTSGTGGGITPPPPGPTQVDVTYSGTGTATCDASNITTFTWTPVQVSGKSVINYTLRINKTPADWAPDVDTPPLTAKDGDRALQAGNNITMKVALTPGQYLDWTIQPGFSDGTVSKDVAGFHFGAFNCPGQGGPGSCTKDSECTQLVGVDACKQNKCVNNQCQSGNQPDGTACKQLVQPFASGVCQSGACQVTTSTGCGCQSNTCLPGCQFTKLSSGTYANPVKCSLSQSVLLTEPTSDNKNSWCSRAKRTLGDADGNGQVNVIDYAYYLRAALGGKIPSTVNPDFNGDGEIGQSDLVIWKQGKGQ